MFRFYDSWGHYNQALLGSKWDVYADLTGTLSVGVAAVISSITQSTTSGRFGAGGCTFAVDSDAIQLSRAPQGQQANQYLQRNYAGQSVVFVGLAVKQNATALATGSRLLTFLDGATTQLGIDIMPSGQLRLIRATSPGTGIYLVSADPSVGSDLYTVMATTANAILSNAFDYLQFKVTHAGGTGGSVEIRRGDGSLFENVTGLNTSISGNDRSSSVLLGGYGGLTGGSAATVQSHFLRATISDFLLYDAAANGDDALDLVTFAGDRHGERITLTADGFYAQSTPSTGATRFDLIEEVPPNTTDFNALPSVGIKDTFVVGAASGPSATTLFIVGTMYSQKTAGGGNEMKMLFRLSGADRNGTAFQQPAPWAFKQSVLFSKPGGGAITVADVQPATGQIGYQKTV